VSVRTIALRTARKRAETALKRVWSLETGPKAAETAADVEGESPSGAAVGDGQAGDGDGFTGSNVKHATRAVQVAPLQRQEFENLLGPADRLALESSSEFFAFLPHVRFDISLRGRTS